jgi:hypothetical protein
MKKALLTILVIGLIAGFSARAFPGSFDSELDKVLFSAESIFKAMEERNYRAIWWSLTGESKRAIVDAVYKASTESHTVYSRKQINTDFEIGGLLSKTYWNGFLAEFDPAIVLEQSQWELGLLKGTEAEINIRYRKAQKPAVLKLYREGGAWKVGLEETFGGRKYLLFQ